jgi:EAL domain-containing protein (putative c-di-GMP-specific phosphodiesterase class I)
MPKTDQKLADRLIAALQEDEFVLYQQTIVPVNPKPDDRPFQEIYVRFTEEDAKMLPPGTFFPILAECELLPYLDRWVVNRLARWVRGALRVRPDWTIPLSNVNLSNPTFEDPEFPEYVLRYVDNSYLSDGALGFELPVEGVMAHAAPVKRLAAALRPHGCRFTLSGLDDGASAIEAIKILTPEFVKFSATRAASRKFSELIRQCQVLEIKIIFEHVESKAMLEQLRKAKVDFAQGFEISPVKPL